MINTFGQLRGYSINRTKLIDTGIGNATKAPKASQQTLATLGANPINILQTRHVARFGTLSAHARNRKAVGLVTHLGNQHQGS